MSRQTEAAHVKIVGNPGEMTMHFLQIAGDMDFTHFLREGQVVHYASRQRQAKWEVPESRDYSVGELRAALGLE